jgi:[acyl-carrier-protein] S-malonyltransferase
MSFAALFPGQGSQSPGMGKSLCEDFSVGRGLFELASDTLKLDFKKLCFEAPEDELAKTANTQPCLLLCAYAGFRILETELGFTPKAAAGHSLGEYTALTAAGALSFPDALKLVRRRGELMASAASSQTGMMAVLGASREQVEQLCREAVREGEILAPANFNAPGQVVISGHNSALERAQEVLKSRRQRGIRLKVSGAFHSPLMEDAAKGLEKILAHANFSPLKFPVVSNLEAKPYPEDPRTVLVRQMTGPVRWEDSVRCLNQMGLKGFIEIGPGQVLAGLVRRILPDSIVLNFSESKDLSGIGTALKN